MKICRKCKIEKDNLEFYKNNYIKDGLQSWCKECYKEADRNPRNKKKRSDRAKQKRKSVEGKRQESNKRLINRYGITLEQKEKMIIDQDYKCLICFTDLRFLKGSNAVCLDHDHKTSIVRGVLCVSCNTSLAWFENKDQIILNYIQKGKHEKVMVI